MLAASRGGARFRRRPTTSALFELRSHSSRLTRNDRSQDTPRGSNHERRPIVTSTMTSYAVVVLSCTSPALVARQNGELTNPKKILRSADKACHAAKTVQFEARAWVLNAKSGIGQPIGEGKAVPTRERLVITHRRPLPRVGRLAVSNHNHIRDKQSDHRRDRRATSAGHSRTLCRWECHDPSAPAGACAESFA